MKNDKAIKIEQKNTYGIGDDFMISAVKLDKTTFIVSSYFTNDREFPNVMDKVIESKVKASLLIFRYLLTVTSEVYLD